MQLTQLDVKEISLVNKAANRKKFAFIKRNDDEWRDSEAADTLELAELIHVQMKQVEGLNAPDSGDDAGAKELLELIASQRETLRLLASL